MIDVSKQFTAIFLEVKVDIDQTVEQGQSPFIKCVFDL
jgi:hypothetical protein